MNFLQTSLENNPLIIIGIVVIAILLIIIGAFGSHILSHRKPKDKELDPKQDHRYRDRLKAVNQLTSILINTLNYERVLDVALDMSAAAFGDAIEGSPLTSAVLFFEERHLTVKTARRFTHADLRANLPGTKGGLAKAVNQGESAIVIQPANDPELGRIVAMRSCESAYCIPLRSGRDVYGILLYGHPERNFFRSENREVLNLIAAQAISAMQNAKLFQSIEQEKERLMEAQEEARKKLARDLHDGPTQAVAAIAMQASFVRRLLERDPDEAVSELFKIEELARNTTKEIRQMLFTLRPLSLESQGLKAALDLMAEKMEENYKQNVVIDIDDSVVESLDMQKLGVIFYLAEEAVNNARKHAQASQILVKLKHAKNEVALLEIRDDGVGFDVEEVQRSYDSRGSLGMINLKERAEMINGILQIRSKPGDGTLIQVGIPLTQEAIERLWHTK